MITGKRSRTAEYNALFRALESRRAPAERLIHDPMAARFLGPTLALVLAGAPAPLIGAAVPGLIDRRWPGPRPSGVIRTKIIDESVGTALARGVEQLVLLGAGYDSRAYRLPGAEHVRVFEVDHPDTQARKRAVVRRALGRLPEHVTYVPLDLARGDLDASLARAGCRRGARTYVLGEGVLSYLDAATVDRVLRWSGEIAGPGSELGITYVHRAIMAGATDAQATGASGTADPAPWVRSVGAVGEPFVLGLDPQDVANRLAAHGWEVTHDESTADALRRLDDPTADIPDFYRLAFARRP